MSSPVNEGCINPLRGDVMTYQQPRRVRFLALSGRQPAMANRSDGGGACHWRSSNAGSCLQSS